MSPKVEQVDIDRARAYIEVVLAVQARHGHGTAPPEAVERAVMRVAAVGARWRKLGAA